MHCTYWKMNNKSIRWREQEKEEEKKHEITKNNWRPTDALVFETTHIHSRTTTCANCINHLSTVKIDYFNLMLWISKKRSEIGIFNMREREREHHCAFRCHTKYQLPTKERMDGWMNQCGKKRLNKIGSFLLCFFCTCRY